ncbi:hypothetical protein CRYUN_Cryun06bG0046900 [Craigia yunnanensis]
MGSVPQELSLDFRPTFVPKTISNFLKEVSLIGNVSDKVSKLDAFVKGLEEEMRKIDAFQRELPLCMLLLNDAIVALKEESMQCMARDVEPVLEEFIPLKKNQTENNYSEDGALITAKKEKDSKNNKDKKNGMRSFQLWNTDDYGFSDHKLDIKRNDEDTFQESKNSRGRAFMQTNLKEEKDEVPVHGLRLLTSEIMKEESGSTVSRTSCSRAVSSSAPNAQSNFLSGPQPLANHLQQQQQQQTTRKQRRCWSPELHRRFVNALQQLGGSQVATPKQIGELMQVDGLTNDEVKSHLQVGSFFFGQHLQVGS